MTTLISIGHIFAAIAFAGLAVAVAIRRPQRPQQVILLLTALASCTWAGFAAARAAEIGVHADGLAFGLESVRNLAWVGFLGAVLHKVDHRLRWRFLLAGLLGLMVLVFWLGLLLEGSGRWPMSAGLTVGIVMSLVSLVLAERIYGLAREGFRAASGHLLVATALIFGFDLVMYTIELVRGDVADGIRAVRGLSNAAAVPFLFVASRDTRDWSLEVFVSRRASFVGFMTFFAGLYALSVAVAVVFVLERGGHWAAAAAAALVLVAAIVLLIVVSSDRLRRKARVFASKHFYRNRYDYREEWHRLTRALYHPGDRRSLADRASRAIAGTMNSSSAMLLARLEGSGSHFEPVTVWQRPFPDDVSEPEDGSLARFLENSQWVVDTRQYHREPDFYGELELPNWLRQADCQQIVVPIILEERLVGMLVLEQETPVTLTYEDTDLLKIVGRQVAGLLIQEQTAEKLAEARQLQAYSRLTAFVMHDLKNLAAQLSLVVKNAAEHRQNPEFVDDAFETIANSAERMGRLIEQLAERDRRERRQRVNVVDIIDAAIRRTLDRTPGPSRDPVEGDFFVMADRDRLFSIFHHLLRNAQEACEEDDSVHVRVEHRDGALQIDIADSGRGMDEAFVRSRLFRPFDSTKGVHGMGIGAFQAREYVRELAGHMRVRSAPGQGTVISISLPLAAGRDDG